MKYFGLMLMLCSLTASASTLDENLQSYIKEFNLQPLSPVKNNRPAVFNLGRSLFMSRLLSGNKNIGCVDCHFPGVMTHDGLPLALGEGSLGRGEMRQQGHGKVLARNTPALFNLGSINVMFWDGRVSYDAETKTFSTPLAALNGKDPARKDITSVMTSALAAQAIFPIADLAEMRGQPGSNELANAKDEFEAWELLVKRLLAEPKLKAEFAAAFPQQQINIGHVGEALAEFQAVAFAFDDTPFDRYLKGELTALTDKQKKGMDVFFDKGKCGACHQGQHLSALDFDSVGVPQIGPGKADGDDIGRAQWDAGENAYTFRVPPLRNVGVTAPYMHNGAFATLAQVVEHYDDIEASLRGYNFGNDWKNYSEKILNHEHSKDDLRLSVMAEDLERKLHFTEEEEEALIEFLETGLTDTRLIRDNSGYFFLPRP